MYADTSNIGYNDIARAQYEEEDEEDDFIFVKKIKISI